MSEESVRLYEGLFLINPTPIGSSLAAATQLVRDLLDRAQAEIVSISKWEDRKLAYPIKGVKRGLYMLAYFRVDGRKIASIERDVTLSDNVVRCLITRTEHIGEVELRLAAEEQTKTQHAAKLQAEGQPAPQPQEAQPQREPEPAGAAAVGAGATG